MFPLRGQDIEGLRLLFPDASPPLKNSERKEAKDVIRSKYLNQSVEKMTEKEVDDNLRLLGSPTSGSIYSKRERLRELLTPETEEDQSPFPNKQKKSAPITIENAAEGELLNIDKTKGGVMVLRGKVIMKLRGGELRADAISIDSKRQEIYAEGGVVFKDQGSKLSGERLIYDLKLNQGVIYNSKLSVFPSFFIGEKIKRLDEKRYLMEVGYFTACNAELPHESFQAKRIIIYEDKSAIAYSITMKVGGTPVFWLPALYNSESGNGWMSQIGKNNSQGWFLQNSYHWSDSYPNSLFLANGYKARFDIYEKTGQAVQLEAWKVSPSLNYNINLGYANYKRNQVTPVYEDRFRDFGVGNVAVTNRVDRGELFPGTGLPYRNVGVDYDPWWKADLRLNAKTQDFNKDMTRNFQLNYENFNNRNFDYEFGNRYEPSNTVLSLYTRRDQRFGLIRNLLNWNMVYTENRGDLSVSLGLSRTLLYQIQANRFFPAQETLPTLTVKNSTQIGTTPMESPIYWDLLFTTNSMRIYGPPTQKTLPFALPPNFTTNTPTGEFRDFLLRTQTMVLGETGFRSPIPLGSYASFTPTIFAGAQKQTAEFPGTGIEANSQDNPSNRAYLQILKQQSFQYYRQAHTFRFGVPELFLTSTYRKLEAQRPEVRDPVLGSLRQHEAEIGLESYALNDWDISINTIRDLRKISSEYQPDITNQQRWYFTVFRIGGFVDFVDGFSTKRPSLLERRRNFYSGIFINNEYVHHSAQGRPLSNNLTLSYKMGGFTWPLIRAFRSLELGSTWYHVYKDNYLDSYRFFLKTDTKINRYIALEMDLDSRVTEPWRLTALAQGQFYANGLTPDLYRSQTGINYDRTTIFEDAFAGSGLQGATRREKAVFNINRFLMTLRLDLHNWEYRIGYSMNLRAFPGGASADNQLTFYDQSVFFSVHLTNINLDSNSSTQATRARLYRFRKRPLDGTAGGVASEAN